MASEEDDTAKVHDGLRWRQVTCSLSPQRFSFVLCLFRSLCLVVLEKGGKERRRRERLKTLPTGDSEIARRHPIFGRCPCVRAEPDWASDEGAAERGTFSVRS